MADSAVAPVSTDGSLSENGTATPRRFTREEYMRMQDAGILTGDDAVELIHGQIVEMSPENKPHRAAIIMITRVLVETLDAERFAVQPQSTLPLDDYNLPEPDVAVLRGTPDELVEAELPVTFVVEVADTSLERDRGVKQSLYADAAIPVYWIVNLAAREMEVYSEPRDGRYREHTTLTADDTVPVPVESVGAVEVDDLLPAVE